ncbi:facilitated trehalose transporter Tret1-like [Uranotaenia lowii]|uniref:facilitated trehalose transporter Tret1-like n=1 Tax=Uranotaenia lowii TaxID=190385 RepID=UPI00247A1A9A|nr:facilitated trehalose transporter Tret1-like [Uranotaenia lowii]
MCCFPLFNGVTRGYFSSPCIQVKKKMGGCSEWFQRNQKNKPQSNTLASYAMTLITSGLVIGSTIFNVEYSMQAWTLGHSSVAVLMVSLSFYLAAMLGTLVGCILVERYPKKFISRIFQVPTLLGSILLTAIPQEIAGVAVARVLIGFGHGVAFLVLPIHASEIVINRQRGANVASISNSVIVGALIFGIISPMEMYNFGMNPLRLIGIVGIVLTGFGGLLSIFIFYESPVFLMKRGRDDKAIKAMMKLRTESVETWELRNDFDELKAMISEEEQHSKSIFSDGNLRPLIVLALAKVATVLSFNMALNVVRILILSTLFLTTTYNTSAMIISGVRVVVTFIAMLTVDRFGRKMSFTFSSLTSGILLTVLGVFFLISQSIHRDVAIGMVLAYEVLASLGLTFIPDVYLSEAFPLIKKSASIGVIQTVENICQLIFVCIMHLGVRVYIGDVLVGCGAPLLALSVVFFLLLPETARMSLRQSSAEFSKQGMNHLNYKVVVQAREP